MSQKALERVEYSPGVRIFHQGDQGNRFFLIEEGKVELVHTVGGREEVLAVLSKGEVFGEMALIDGKPRSATARALVATTVCIVPESYFNEYLNRTPPLVRKIMNVLAERLRDKNLLPESKPVVHW